MLPLAKHDPLGMEEITLTYNKLTLGLSSVRQGWVVTLLMMVLAGGTLSQSWVLGTFHSLS